MTKECITKHKLVSLTYTIRDEDGNDLERIDVPVSYVQGTDIGPFERIESALEGHVAGDVVEVTLPPGEAFGDHDPSLTFTDDIENVPPEFRRVGAEVEFQNENGDSRLFVVSRIEDNRLTVDGNHPLAGKALLFTVTVVDVRDATPEEIANGPAQFGGKPGVLH
jgi:FKBP-type peptidyl-prolyl cis-trans isomerase SlyD